MANVFYYHAPCTKVAIEAIEALEDVQVFLARWYVEQATCVKKTQ